MTQGLLTEPGSLTSKTNGRKGWCQILRTLATTIGHKKSFWKEVSTGSNVAKLDKKRSGRVH